MVRSQVLNGRPGVGRMITVAPVTSVVVLRPLSATAAAHLYRRASRQVADTSAVHATRLPSLQPSPDRCITYGGPAFGPAGTHSVLRGHPQGREARRVWGGGIGGEGGGWAVGGFAVHGPGIEVDARREAADLERMLTMPARRALRFSASADASNVGAHSLDMLRAEAARLAVAYPQQPLPEIIADIAALQDMTFTLLEGRQPPRETRDLYVFGGLFSGMLAKAAHDMREPYTAMAHARTALLCAHNAEHQPLAAWVTALQSLIAYWAGRPREALGYARSAAAEYSGSGSVQVWLAALEARAWASLGNASESMRAIERASDLRDGHASDGLDDFGGMCYFSPARQLYYAADACAS